MEMCEWKPSEPRELGTHKAQMTDGIGQDFKGILPDNALSRVDEAYEGDAGKYNNEELYG